jgi:hypothetical protein
MSLLPKRENQTKEDLERDFEMAMDWIGGSSQDREEFEIKFT